MRKSDIERLARRRQQQAKPTATHGNAPRIAQDRADASGGKSHGHTCACACGGEFERLVNALIEIGPILARIAAVDTVRTTEQPATLFRRAVSEGVEAAAILRNTLNGGAAQ